MLLFKDIFTGDEICSDAFPMADATSNKKIGFEGVKPEDVEAAVLKVSSKKIIPNGDGEIDVGCGSAFGGSAEDEEAPMGADGSPAVPVIDVVHFNNLQSTPLNAMVWKAWFMDFCKTLKSTLEAKDAANGNTVLSTRFKKNFPAIKEWGLTTVGKNIDDYEFYICKSSDFPESNKSLIIPAKYDGEAASPDFYFIIDGMEIEKC
jgi:hypothetical protein